MPHGFGQNISQKQIVFLRTSAALPLLNPKKIFDISVFSTRDLAASLVEIADVCGKRRSQLRRSLAISIKVKAVNFFMHDPGRHWVDVETYDIAAKAVGLNEWCATAHERVRYLLTWKTVRLIVRLRHAPVAEFRQR